MIATLAAALRTCSSISAFSMASTRPARSSRELPLLGGGLGGGAGAATCTAHGPQGSLAVNVLQQMCRHLLHSAGGAPKQSVTKVAERPLSWLLAFLQCPHPKLSCVAPVASDQYLHQLFQLAPQTHRSLLGAGRCLAALALAALHNAAAPDRTCSLIASMNGKKVSTVHVWL